MLHFADFTDLADGLAGATIVPLRELLRVERSAATLAYYDSRRGYVIPDVRAMMRIGPPLPNDSLAEGVSAGIPGVTVHVGGNARSPRRIRNAIREANDFARRL